MNRKKHRASVPANDAWKPEAGFHSLRRLPPPHGTIPVDPSLFIRFTEERTGQSEAAAAADLGNSALGKIGEVNHAPRTDFRPHHRDAPGDQLFCAVGVAGILETLPLPALRRKKCAAGVLFMKQGTDVPCENIRARLENRRFRLAEGKTE